MNFFSLLSSCWATVPIRPLSSLLNEFPLLWTFSFSEYFQMVAIVYRENRIILKP